MKILKNQLFNLHKNTKTQIKPSKYCFISLSTINKLVKQYFEIKTKDGYCFTAKQIKELQKRNAQVRRRKSNFKEGYCYLHSTLKQRLNAIFTLRTQHSIKLLCKFNVYRSTYKYISNNVPPRIEKIR